MFSNILKVVTFFLKLQIYIYIYIGSTNTSFSHNNGMEVVGLRPIGLGCMDMGTVSGTIMVQVQGYNIS